MAKSLRQILNEISKDTLTNYAIKASSDRLRKSEEARQDRLKHNTSPDEDRANNMSALKSSHEKWKLKDANRFKGIKKAVDKIAKE